MCGCSLRGNREISSLTVGARTDRRPASGRREAEADDARAGEVRPRRSSCEACEQRRAIGRGVGWSQGRGPRGRRGNYTRDGLRAAQACHRSCTAYGRPVRQVLTGRPSSPAAGAVCPNRARTDLCGGRPVMGVPTAINGRPRTAAINEEDDPMRPAASASAGGIGRLRQARAEQTSRCEAWGR